MMHLVELFSVVYYINPPLIENIVIFGENYPIFWLLDDFRLNERPQQEFFSCFRQYLNHITCGRVHSCCVVISITSRSYDCKNYFAPSILVRPLLFYLWDFASFLDGIWKRVCDLLFKSVFRFTLAIQISEPWGAKAPQGTINRFCVDFG